MKRILIIIDEKKHKKFSELKERHGMTWEDLLDVAFRLSK